MNRRPSVARSLSHRKSILSLFDGSELQPHPLFCEISELHTSKKKNQLWKETARMVKYIETVDESGLWSKPHVATISMHNLIELKQALADGVVLFRQDETEYDLIIENLIFNLVENGNLAEENSKKFKDTMSLAHVHQFQKEFSKELNFGKKHKLTKKNKNKADAQLKESPELRRKNTADNSHDYPSDDESVVSYDSDFEEILKKQAKNCNLYFRKKIPEDAYAANFMVGTVDYLEKEVIALVELTRPTVFENMAEVNIPTKYIFIALTPTKDIYKMQQIGRCCAAVFSDEIFQNDLTVMRYKHDLIASFDSFLDQSTVIPPGEWDTTIRLEPPAKVPSKTERLFYKKTKKIKIEKSRYAGHDNDPCLVRTGKFAGGLIADIKRKLPWYKSDFTDAFNFQCIPVIGFLYFACLTPIVTFGGLLGFATDNNMGAIESLVSALFSGVLYSLFAGQPMTIIGSTGPVLVFESILNTFSKTHGIDYMGFRVWVGLWICFFLLIICLSDLSFLVQYITRFTEELFAILIAIIFVHESIDKLLKIRHSYKFTNNPYDYSNTFNENSTGCFRCFNAGSLENSTDYVPGVVSEFKCEELGHDYKFTRDCDNIPDVFFFSVILYLLTFILAMTLRDIKFSNFFSTGIRQNLSNFGVVITIATMVFLDYRIGLDTPKLHVPSSFNPTITTRGWFIDPIQRQGDKWWLCLLAIVPALLATILIFMDQQITAVIVNRESNKFKKSAGYHLDLFVIAITIAVNSLFGLPWMVAATVLSMNHVISLRKISPSTVPGEGAKLTGAIEQRVTGTLIFLLVGFSIFITDYLKHIPMPVLYAIFMYMGITPMGELDFYKRIQLLFMPKKHQPDYVFTRNVRLPRVHLFTAVQLVCLVILYALKMNKSISITFPMMVVALIFIRFGLNYVFTDIELHNLDDILPPLRSKKVIRSELKDPEKSIQHSSDIILESQQSKEEEAFLSKTDETKSVEEKTLPE